MSDGFLGVPPQILAGVPVFQANKTYTVGQRVIAPSGDVVTAKASFTSTATYVAADWNASTQDGRLAAVELDKFRQPLLGATVDLDTVWAPGTYPLVATPTDYTAQHYPVVGGRGTLFVQEWTADNGSQLFIGVSVSAPRVFIRYKQSGVVGPWVELTGQKDAAITAANTSATAYTDSTKYVRPFLASGTDLDSVTTPGDYPANATLTDWVAQHYPVNVRGHLNVQKANTWIFQEFKTAEPTTRFFTRYYNSVSWTAWKEQTPDIMRTIEGVGFLGIRHAMLKDDMEAYHGGPVPTAGAAPVALTFDDYPRDFRDRMRAELTSRGIPYTLALSSRMYDPAAIGQGTWGAVYDGAAGTSWSEINGWLIPDGAEVANHGATHNGTSTQAGLYAEIVQGHIDLSANLPAKPIWCWIQPSATYDAGFLNGDSINAYATTLAGKYILDRHALATGVRLVNGLNRVPRRGKPVQGLTRQWISSASGIAATKTAIQAATTAKHGIIIGSHANDIPDGRITEADFTGFLDWLIVEQTAGRIKLMTLSKWAIADTGP